MFLHDSVNGFKKNLSKQIIVIKGHVLQTLLALTINIFTQMKLNFHKINSFFSSIDDLMVIGSAQQCRSPSEYGAH
jgi:hypothetical protein